MTRRLVFFLLLSCFSGYIFGLDSLAVQAGGGTESWPELVVEELPNGQTIIPLKRVGNLFLIEAQVDSLIGDFVLDLGAPCLVLNATYFRNYYRDNRYLSGTMNATAGSVRRIKIEQFSIQDLSYKKLTADVADLGEIENQRGVKILGLLGVQIFRAFTVDIDVHNLRLILHNQFESDQIGSPMIFNTSFEVVNNVIITHGKLNKVSLTLSLDSGSETNVLHNKLPTKTYRDMKILKRTEIIDGNGKRSETLLAVPNGIFIEGVPMKKMRSLILNLNTISRVYDSDIDGMLGYPFFASGRVVIDFNRLELLLFQYKKID